MIAALFLALCAAPPAEPRLFLGAMASDEGLASDLPLHFAESDARELLRFGQALLGLLLATEPREERQAGQPRDGDLRDQECDHEKEECQFENSEQHDSLTSLRLKARVVQRDFHQLSRHSLVARIVKDPVSRPHLWQIDQRD